MTKTRKPRNTYSREFKLEAIGGPFKEVAICPICEGKFGSGSSLGDAIFRSDIPSVPNSRLSPVVGP